MSGKNGNSACPCPKYWDLQMLLNGRREGMTESNGRRFRDAALPAEDLWAQGRVGAWFNHCLLPPQPPDRILFWQHIWIHCTGGVPAASLAAGKDNQIYWAVWVRWPGTTWHHLHHALMDTGAQCTLLSLCSSDEWVVIHRVSGEDTWLPLLEGSLSLNRQDW